ncbi:MAG: hypothetical protein FJX34_02085 [Alphaproteobacteria bacterium]|nr:hypothetical protein [Alphaproteobacteria bacterium]
MRKIIVITLLSLLAQGCTSYNTDLNEMEKIRVKDMSEIKRGESCSQNILGGFSIPYIGDTAVRILGDESVIAAIKNAGIKDVYAVDKKKRNYFIYSKRCTIVFGK